MNIKKDLLDILACPQCETPVHLDENNGQLICNNCGKVYPVIDDIPVMLINQPDIVGYEKFAETKTESIKFYDDFYKSRNDYRRFSRSDIAFAKAIFNKLDFQTDTPKILDLGAGTGYFGKVFNEVDNNLQVYSSDFSLEGFKTAKEMYKLDRLALMDAYSMAYLPGSFDAIFTIGLTPFKKRLEKDIIFLIERIIRPLKKNGYYVFIWSTNLRGSIIKDVNIRSTEFKHLKSTYYNHTRGFIKSAFENSGAFSAVEDYVFIRPTAPFLQGFVFSRLNTILSEFVMKVVPSSLSARLLVIGRKK